MSDFVRIDPRSLRENPFGLVADEWMIVAAGSPGTCGRDWNGMTASWGGFGELWNHDVAFVFVRPTRHSYGFMEAASRFSLSFLGEGHREALRLFGSLSGRDHDKAAEAGLARRDFDSGGGAVPGFEEARLVLALRKLYAADIDPSRFVDPALAAHYPDRDWHRMYVGAVEGAWAPS